MRTTSAPLSPSSAQVVLAEAAPRPDTAVLLGGGDPRAAIRVAVDRATAGGGQVCVVRCVDNTGIRSPRKRVRRSAAARAQLARIVSEWSAVDQPDVTERLHVGTLPSLLSTLGRSIGALIVSAPDGPLIREVVALCPVPVYVVDDAGVASLRGDSAGGAGGGG